MIMCDEGDISSHKPCKYVRLSSLRGKVHNCTIGYKGLNFVTLAFHILLVIPATNATSERSFSALRRIKSYLRSTMTQDRLKVAGY